MYFNHSILCVLILFAHLYQNFFAELDNRKTELGILNIQIGLSTLEEVFLSIAKKAELEGAASEGTIKPLILPSGTTLQVGAPLWNYIYVTGLTHIH